MKLWNEATRNDIVNEVIPGIEVLDDAAIEKLDWTSYLAHIQDCVREELNQDEDFVRGHFDDLLFLIYVERIRAERGEYPGIEKIMAYRSLPGTKDMIENLTNVIVNLTMETWPEYKKKVCEKVGNELEELNRAFE